MSILQLITDLEKIGIRLSLEDENLKYRAPKGALTPEIRDKLGSKKSEIIRFLRDAWSGNGDIFDKIPQANHSHPLKLSYEQQQLWLNEQLMDKCSSTFHVPMALTLRGILDVRALQEAFLLLIARHESLRTIFYFEQGEPRQKIRETLPFDLEEISLTTEFQRESEVHAKALAQAFIRKPFDLNNGPLIRAKLMLLDVNYYCLVVVMHHIISDACSMDIFIDEMITLYKSCRINSAVDLRPLEIQYADYAQWQRSTSDNIALKRQLEYWKEQLYDAPQNIALPLDYPRPTVKTNAGSNQAICIKGTLLSRLTKIAKQEDVTLYVLFLTAFKIVLNRSSNQNDISVGMPIAGRNQLQLEGVLGCFINTLVIRTTGYEKATFKTLLAEVKEQVLSAQANPDVPVERIVDALGIERSPSYSPLCQVTFSWVVDAEQAHNRITAAGLEVTPMDVNLIGARQDITLMLVSSPSEIRGVLEYNVDLFKPKTIEALSIDLTAILSEMAKDITVPIAHIHSASLDSGFSQKNINVKRLTTTPDKAVPDLIQAQIAMSPGAIAVTCGSLHLTYDALGSMINQFASWLAGKGVQPGDYVALCVDRCAELPALMIAIGKCGAVYVPIDPGYPKERIAYILQDCNAKVVITSQTVMKDDALWTEIDLAQSTPLIIDYESAFDQASRTSDSEFTSLARLDSTIYVIYTSGSTGTPKGVQISHRSESNLLKWYREILDLSPSDSFLIVSALGFDLTQKNIFAPLISGGTLVLMPPQPYDPIVIADAIHKHQVSIWNSAPSAFYPVCQLTGHQAYPFSSLRHVVLGGEAIKANLVSNWLNSPLTHCQLMNSYGPTECTDVVAYWQTKEITSGSAPLPIGSPIPNTQLYVIGEDGNRLDFQGTNQEQPCGELCIAGDGVGIGYINKPELTNTVFTNNPFGTGRCYLTGDLVKYDSVGMLVYVGRKDNQVKVRGFRIELGEVESCLTQAPFVTEAVVILDNDSFGTIGADSNRLIAYLTGNNGIDVGLAREYATSKLPIFMVPSKFVLVDSIPLTPNGKIDKDKLPSPHNTTITQNQDQLHNMVPRTGSKKGSIKGSKTEYKDESPGASTRERQNVLTTLWQQLLSIDSIGLHDNFFSLGGDSILAIQLTNRARQLGVCFTAAQVFECQTIAALSDVASDDTIEIIAEQGLIGGSVLLTPAQQGFFNQVLTDNHHFNQSMLLAISPEVSALQLQQVWEVILHQHDAFRLNYHRDESGNTQQCFNDDVTIADLLKSVYQEIDLRYLPSREQQKAIKSNADKIQSSLNLSDGPLLRVVYFNLGVERPSRMLVVVHHLIMDGVSWRILLEDVEAGLELLGKGESVSLGPKTSSFQQWADALDVFANNPKCIAGYNHWHAIKTVDIAQLPQDIRSNVPLRSTQSSVSSVDCILSEQITKTLLVDSTQCYKNEVNELLLAALSITLGRWADSSNVLIELEGHGRESIHDTIDVSRTVGWFTTMYPVLLNAGMTASLGTHIKTVKETIRTLPMKGMNYGLLRYLSKDQSLKDSMASIPKAQVCFNYLGQLDQVLQNNQRLTPTKEYSGQEFSLNGERYYLIEITCRVMNNCLHINWRYNDHLYHESTINRVSEELLEDLKTVISHCRDKRNQGHTPSDFPLAALTQVQIDSLLPDQSIESVYPLSPVQEGMLFHYRYKPNSWAYLEQISVSLIAGADRKLLERSWILLTDRHPILRTAFIWEGLDRPLQVVHSNVQVTLDHHDWGDLSVKEADNKLQEFLTEDRNRGFDLTKPGAFRLAWISLPEKRIQWVWSYHHILLDGWSIPIVLRELFQIYDALVLGDDYNLPTAPNYQQFIQWRQNRKEDNLENFWSNYLHGIVKPTALPIKTSMSYQPNNYEEISLRIKPETHAKLSKLASTYSITLNLILQGVWALLLSRHSGEECVLFGSTVSGRPAELPGVERMVGMFINTLPIKMQIDSAMPFLEWVSSYQPIHAKLSAYESDSLVDIKQYSDIPNAMPMFYSILVYENFPVSNSLEDQSSAKGILSVDAYQQTDFPLTVICSGGETLGINISYDSEMFENNFVEKLLEQFGDILGSIPQNLTSPISTLCHDIFDELALRAPTSELSGKSESKPYTKPKNDIEKQLVLIWKDLLQAEIVGIHDNFFELGGHSLLATSACSRIQNTFNIEIPVRAIFETPTIAELAGIIEALHPLSRDIDDLEVQVL